MTRRRQRLLVVRAAHAVWPRHPASALGRKNEENDWAPPTVAAPVSTPKRPWWRRRWVLIITGAIATLIVISAVAPRGQSTAVTSAGTSSSITGSSDVATTLAPRQTPTLRNTASSLPHILHQGNRGGRVVAGPVTRPALNGGRSNPGVVARDCGTAGPVHRGPIEHSARSALETRQPQFTCWKSLTGLPSGVTVRWLKTRMFTRDPSAVTPFALMMSVVARTGNPGPWAEDLLTK
jgi:hypothetical protein